MKSFKEFFIEEGFSLQNPFKRKEMSGGELNKEIKKRGYGRKDHWHPTKTHFSRDSSDGKKMLVVKNDGKKREYHTFRDPKWTKEPIHKLKSLFGNKDQVHKTTTNKRQFLKHLDEEGK